MSDLTDLRSYLDSGHSTFAPNFPLQFVDDGEADRLDAGDGDDIIVAGGNDVILSGDGADDIYVLDGAGENPAIIEDFNATMDEILFYKNAGDPDPDFALAANDNGSQTLFADGQPFVVIQGSTASLTNIRAVIQPV